MLMAGSPAESGCVSFHVFESVREPIYFAIHSEWTDESAFEHHATLPDKRSVVSDDSGEVHVLKQ